MSGSNVKMAGAGIAAAILFVVAFVSWLRIPDPETAVAQAPATAPASAEPQDPLLESRTKGSEDAPITVFELSDFQCPFCRRFWEETLPDLDAEYIATGKIRFIFINLPLASIHPNAPAAHEFAMCAAKQDQFWEVHDGLYDTQEEWSNLPNPVEFFYSISDDVGLDRGPLDQCLSQGDTRSIIMADIEQARRGNITSTPTFVIEGGLLPGAQPMEVWRPILDSIVTAKGAS